MPEYLVKTPSGTNFKLVVPEGMSTQDAIAKAKERQPDWFKAPAAKPAEPQSPGVGSVLKESFFPSEIPPDPAAEKPAQTVLGGVKQTLSDIPREWRREYAKGIHDIGKGVGDIFSSPTWTGSAWGGVEALGGVFQTLGSIATGPARALMFNPLSRTFDAPVISELGGIGVGMATSWTGAPTKIAKAAGLIGKTPGEAVPGVEATRKALGMAQPTRTLGSEMVQKPAEKTAESWRTGKLAAFEKLLSPTTRTAESGEAGRIITQANAEAALNSARAAESLEPQRKIAAAMAEPERLNFMRAMYGKAPMPEAVKDLGKALRVLYDDREKQLIKLGLLERANKEYYGIIWKNKDKADEYFSSRGSLRGGSDFLKSKTFNDSIIEGMAQGLELTTTNPIDMTLTRIGQIDRFLAAHSMRAELERTGLARRIKNPAEVPPKWMPIGDRLFGGDFYAPQEVVRLFDNITTAGFSGNNLYKFFRSIANTLNRAQLIFPGFHGQFIMNDSAASSFAQGIQQAANKEFKGALVNMAKGLEPVGFLNARKLYREGSKIRDVALGKLSGTPEEEKVIKALVSGGARFDMDMVYRVTESGSFMRAIQNGSFTAEVMHEMQNAVQMNKASDLGKLLVTPMKLMLRGFETASAPLMEVAIPRIKVGAMTNMAQDWLRVNPHASPQEVRAAMQKIVDSVDNRMGEVVYDNIFWNKMFKDTMFLLVRAVGWNLGTIRELGGGVVDFARYAADFATYNNPEFTTRMAYALSMIPRVTVQGAFMNYLFTGKPPETLNDYFFPKTGRILPSGQPERTMLIDYFKDLQEYNRSVWETMKGKAHPAIVTVKELVDNRAWNGKPIYKPRVVAQAERMNDLAYALEVSEEIVKDVFLRFMPIGEFGDLVRGGLGAATGLNLERPGKKTPGLAGERTGYDVAWDIARILGMPVAPQRVAAPEAAEQGELRAILPGWKATARKQ